MVCLGERDSGEPDDRSIRDVEGWILGRVDIAASERLVEDSEMIYSPHTDPDLAEWIRWASESGEVPSFTKEIAEAALMADLPHYALLRPVLLELKRQHPENDRWTPAGLNRRRD
jgi:hypothetical protein